MKRIFSFRPLLSRRAPSLLLPSLCIAAGLLVQGCPSGGSLENKEEFLGPNTGDGGPPCDVGPIFEQCAGSICHQAEDGMAPGGGVDFFAPGFGPAMLDKPTSYANVRDPENCPEVPEMLIDSSNVSDSLLLKKVRHEQTCGDPMPPLALAEPEIECLEAWAQWLIDQPSTGTGGADAGTGGGDAGTGGDGMGTGGDGMGTGGDGMGTGGGDAMPMTIRVEAESGETSSGEVMLEADMLKVGYLDEGDALTFENVNVAGLNEVTFNFAKENTTAGSIEVHTESADGPLVGTFTPTTTGDWATYTSASIPLSMPLTGTQTIVLVFVGGTSICNLDWFELSVGAAAP